ncbi:MAG: nucleotidyl transferase AbiEii/AbiGii toxin family protein [Culicoidibacterales bacterium]
MINEMSLKAKINNYARKNKIMPQVVMQNYMFERFLDRLSHSNYKDNFVIKGGILIAAIVGLDTRSTMDLDTTIERLSIEEENIQRIINEISQIELNDNVIFDVKSLESIRKNDVYGGLSVRIDAKYGTIITNLSIDISTGDIITPHAVEYEFDCIFEDTSIKVKGYNIETVLAEKIETIISRGVLNTRPRDFYDIYILTNTQRYDTMIFNEALLETAKHRDTNLLLNEAVSILEEIKLSDTLKNNWIKYQRQFQYARDISFEETVIAIMELINIDRVNDIYDFYDVTTEEIHGLTKNHQER